MFAVGLVVAAAAAACIAAGRLLGRIRTDAAGKIFLGLGGFFLALDIALVGAQIWWIAPLSIAAGLLVGGMYIRKRGLRT
jgi:hypothetical protein